MPPFFTNPFRASLRLLLGAVLAIATIASSVANADQPIKAVFEQPKKIVVIGDVHGDYDAFRQLLQLTDIIDKKDRWTGGKTHLVQLGDLPDRGDDTLKVIKLLQSLQSAAERKGGKVHVLVGNHDAMNVYGDLRYATKGEFAAFASKKSEALREKYYQQEIDWTKENLPQEEWPTFDEQHRKNWYDKHPPGFLEHRYYWQSSGQIGSWVRSRPCVLKLGNTLFIHGGLGPEFLDWSIDDLNSAVSAALQSENMENTIVRNEDGPLWYRGLALNDEADESAHVDALLEHFGVERIILGHTVTKGIILPRFDGKVILSDVGLSHYYGENLAALVIEKDKLTAIHRSGEVALPPSTSTAELLDYFEKVSALEPKNKAIKKRIQKLEQKSLTNN